MISLKNKKNEIIKGETTSERENLLMSGKAVYEAIKKLGFDVVLIDVDKNVATKLVKEKIQIAYVILHGAMGEDGTIQGMLEIMGIAYTGCRVFSSSASIDKIISKKMFEYAKIPTAKWFTIEKNKPFDMPKFPVVVKPASQGSAIGVSIVKNKKDFKKAVKLAFSFEDRVLVEQYIKGMEITVGVLNGKPLPVIEIVPKGKFYDFKSKYTIGQSTHIIPARLPNKVLKKAQDIALKIFSEFMCNGICRVDMIVDKKNSIYVLELNTLPGMTKTSLFPDAAKYIGMSFENLVLEILKSAR